jgi:hypothetical protein
VGWLISAISRSHLPFRRRVLAGIYGLTGRVEEMASGTGLIKYEAARAARAVARRVRPGWHKWGYEVAAAEAAPP